MVKRQKANSVPNYFAVLPAAVRYDDNLCPNAKLLYAEITALCGKEGYCWAGNVYFATLYKCHVTTISRWVKLLADRGYITVEIDQKNNHKRRINLLAELLTPLSENANSSTQNCKEALSKNANSSTQNCKEALSKNAKPYIRMNNTMNNKINRERGKTSENPDENKKSIDTEPVKNSPSLGDVFKYFSKAKLLADPNAFYDYYTGKGWPEKGDWRALARNFARREKNPEKYEKKIKKICSCGCGQNASVNMGGKWWAGVGHYYKSEKIIGR